MSTISPTLANCTKPVLASISTSIGPEICEIRAIMAGASDGRTLKHMSLKDPGAGGTRYAMYNINSALGNLVVPRFCMQLEI